MNRLLASASLAVLLISSAPAWADYYPGTPLTNTGDVSGASALVNGGTAARTLKSRFTGFYDPRDYGAICDGSSHPISTALSLTTLAAIQAVPAYSWLTAANWSFHVALVVQGGAASGATNLTVNSVSGLAAGMTVTGTGIPSGDTIASVTAASGAALPFITLTTALTAAMPAFHTSASSTNFIEVSLTTIPDATVKAGETDWLATQSAIQAATAAGGLVQMPATCVFSNANSAGSLMGTLILPIGQTGTAQVSIGTSGSHGTALLNWPTDLGAGRAGVSDGVPWATPANGLGRYNPSNYYYGDIEGLSLMGPTPFFTVGQAPNVAMTGYDHGARRVMRNTYVQGMLIGASYEGDHTPWYNAIFDRNQGYDLYFDYQNSVLGGDNECFDCQFSGAFAGIAVNYGAILSGFHMHGGYTGNNWAKIYGEPVPAGATALGLATDYAENGGVNSEWNAVQFYDATGDTITYSNGAVSAVTVASSKVRGLTRVQEDFGYPSLAGYGGPNPTIAARSVPWTINVGPLAGVRFTGWEDFSRGGANGAFGTSGLINTPSVGSQFGGLVIEGDINGLATAMENSGLKLINDNAANNQYNTVLRNPGTDLEAHLMYTAAGCGSTHTPVKGQFVEFDKTCNGNAAPLGLNTGDAFGGVALTDKTGNGNILVQTRGIAYGMPSSGAITVGTYVKAGTANVVQAASLADSAIGKSFSTVGTGTNSINLQLIPQE